MLRAFAPSSLFLSIWRPHVLCGLLTLVLPLLVIHIPALEEQTGSWHSKAGVSTTLWVYAAACSVSMWIGYRFMERRREPERALVQSFRLAAPCQMVCMALSLIGLAILLCSASEGYFGRVWEVVQSGTSDAALRYDADSPFAGAVTGVFRMFEYLPSGALVLLAAAGTLDRKYARSRGFAATGCLLFAILAFKSALALSRVELFCCVGTLLSVTAVWLVNRSKKFRRTDAAVLGLTGLVAAFCSSLVARSVELVRGIPTPGRSPLLEYVDLSFANAELALRTCTQHGFGFETFLHAFRFADRYFGGLVELPATKADWIWNPAENLLGASLLDFGMFGFVVFAFYGLLFGAASRKAFSARPKLHWMFAYWSLLWGLFSIWQVPVIRAPDYWASFGACFIAAWMLDRLSRRRAALKAAARSSELWLAGWPQTGSAVVSGPERLQRRF
jgi:hypothetical protein